VGIAGAISTRAMKLAQIFDAVAKRHGLTRRTLAFTEYADGDNQNFYITQTNAVGAHPARTLRRSRSCRSGSPTKVLRRNRTQHHRQRRFVRAVDARELYGRASCFISTSSRSLKSPVTSKANYTAPIQKVVLEKHYNAELLDTVTIPYARHEGNKIIPAELNFGSISIKPSPARSSIIATCSIMRITE